MNDLYELSTKPEGLRDHLWEQNFLQAFVSGNVSLLEDTPKAGPDGWPYMLLKTEKSSAEPTRSLIHWATENGVGLVLNPDKQLPDFIFSFGMLWSFRERGMFIAPVDEEDTSNEVVFSEGEKVHAGEPSSEYLPDYARKIVRTFLKDQGLQDPKFLCISRDQKNYDLFFSLESFGNPDKSEHQGILEALSWFFPNDYALVLAPEKGLPEFFSI